MKDIKILERDKGAIHDETIIYNQGDVFVVFVNRPEFINDLKAIREVENSGIYILYSTKNNKIYAGQASERIFDRLRQHFNNKDWWDHIIFFGDFANGLNKAKLDFLEKKLITVFSESDDFEPDNKTIGNNSIIDKFDEIETDELFDIVTDIVTNVANNDIFQRTSKSVNNKRNKYRYHDEAEFDFKGGFKQALRTYMETYKNEIDNFEIPTGPALAKNIVGTQHNLGQSGELAEKVKGANWYFYNNYNTEYGQRKLMELSDRLGHTLTIDQIPE